MAVYSDGYADFLKTKQYKMQNLGKGISISNIHSKLFDWQKDIVVWACKKGRAAVFMNPPYSAPTAWVKRAYEESLKGKLIVGLLRGDTSTAWFHDWVLGKAELRFVKGCIKFNGKPAPFPSIIAIYKGN